MKKLTAIILALLLLTGAVSVLGEVRKNEVVYARLSASGEVKDMYIVNAFEADQPEEVTDYGRYDAVTNLSGTEALAYQDGAAKLSLPAGRFYYQGSPQEKALPWDIAIRYTLDGQPVEDPQALSGAQGKLEIAMDVKVREQMAAYAGGMTLQITMTLDGDTCLNITSDKATIALAGGNQTIAYVVLPGQSAGFAVTADVRDFAMPGIQIAGLRMNMDTEQYQRMSENMLAGNPMAQAVGPMIDNFVKALSGTASQSFADTRNGNIHSLQFVLMTDEIAAPAPAPAPEAEPQDTPREESVTDRFLSLFGG